MDDLLEGRLVAPDRPQPIEGRRPAPARSAEVARRRGGGGQRPPAACAPAAPQGLEPPSTGQAEPEDQGAGTLFALAAEADRWEDEIQDGRQKALCDGPGFHA